MKKILLFLLLLPFFSDAQLFRSIQKEYPLYVIRKVDTGKYGTLVRKQKSVSDSYYFLSSDSLGNIKYLKGRLQGLGETSIKADMLSYVASYPSPSARFYVDVLNCGYTDGQKIGTWNANGDDLVIEEFSGKKWITQRINQNPHSFVVRGKNILTSGNVTVTDASFIRQECVATLENETTGTGGIELSTNFVTPDGYEKNTLPDNTIYYTTQGTVGLSNGTIQVAVFQECQERNGISGVRFRVEPITPETNINRFLVTGIPNSNYTNQEVIKEASNQWWVKVPTGLTGGLTITLQNENDSYEFVAWSNSCNHSGCPTNCPTNNRTITLNSYNNSTASATWNGTLEIGQTLNWYNTNTTTYTATNTWSGAITDITKPVILHAQPTQNNGTVCEWCHGWTELHLRSHLTEGGGVGVSDVYSFPSLSDGSSWYDASGNITLTFMQLQLNQVGNTWILKDLQADDDKILSYPNDPSTKKYLIGFGSETETQFTRTQLKNGIDVTAYSGREITVTAYMHSNFNTEKTFGTRQQTIFVPKIVGKSYGVFTESGVTYYQYPTTRIFGQSMNLPSFEDYITSMNVGSQLYSIQISTMKQLNTPTWQNIGVVHPNSNSAATKMIGLSDSWLTDIGHPPAYSQPQYVWNTWYTNLIASQGGEAQARSYIISRFVALLQPFANYKYIFINNELIGYWNPTFMSWIRDAYAQFATQYPNSNVVGWNSHRLALEPAAYLSSTGYPNGLTALKNGTFSDLTFSSGSNFQTYQNWTGKYTPLKPDYDMSWGSNINQVGGYVFSLLDSYNVYKVMVEGMLYERHNIPGKTIATIWTEVEPTKPSFLLARSDAKLGNTWYSSNVKSIIGSEAMYALGAAYAFFLDGFDLWSYPALHLTNNGNGLYPYENVFRTSDNSKVSVTTSNGYQSFMNYSPVNSLMDGVWAVNQNRTIIDNAPAQIADVQVSGVWKTGADAYPFGASQGGYPVVAYRRSGNDVVVFAYQYNNHTTKDVTFRLTTGEVKTIKLNGCYPTIAKYTL